MADKPNLILDGEGTAVVRRVLEAKGGRPKREWHYNSTDTRFFGRPVTVQLTYDETAVTSRTFLAEGRAIIIDNESGNVVTMRGFGVSRRQEGESELLWQGYAVTETRVPQFEDVDNSIVPVQLRVHDDGSSSFKAVEWQDFAPY